MRLGSQPRIELRRVTLFLFLYAAAAWAQCPVLIDNFGTGKYKAKLDSGSDQKFQTGTMFTGARRTTFIVGQPFTTNPLQLSGLAEIRTPPPSMPGPGLLIVSMGTEVNWVLEVFYGIAGTGAPMPGNLNLKDSGCGKFRLTMRSADTGPHLIMNVYTNDFATFSKAEVFIPPSGSSTAIYTFDIPFKDFTSGSPTAANFADIDFISLEFLAGTPVAGDDFAILKIEALPLSTP